MIMLEASFDGYMKTYPMKGKKSSFCSSIEYDI